MKEKEERVLFYGGKGMSLIPLVITERRRRADPRWQPRLVEIIPKPKESPSPKAYRISVSRRYTDYGNRYQAGKL